MDRQKQQMQNDLATKLYKINRQKQQMQNDAVKRISNTDRQKQHMQNDLAIKLFHSAFSQLLHHIAVQNLKGCVGALSVEVMSLGN